jgi:glycosyltransferase involved in cell wall biosynthesis
MDNRPRIVIDGRYLGSRASGIGTYVRALISRIPALAPDLQLRVWVRDPSDVPPDSRGSVQIHQVAAMANGVLSLVAPTSLDRLMPHDVFHATYNILGRGLPCRSIVTVHDVMWVDAPADCQPDAWRRPISAAYFGNGIRRALRQARRILTVSNVSARRIQGVDPSTIGKIIVTPNACAGCFRPPDNLDAVQSRVATMLGIHGRYFLLVGQNQPSKGHEVALRAFAEANLPNAWLVLVQRLRTGNGLVRLARQLGIGDRVRFVGELAQSDLVATMQSATALLQPSTSEGFGLPALEAVACACPVLASELPVFHEVLDNAALFLPAGNVSAWAQAMSRLFTDSRLERKMRLLGPVRAMHFSWDRTAERTMRAYREIVEENCCSMGAL